MKAASIVVQQKDHWKEHDKIKKMQFSNKWINGFLKRGGLSRRKITRDDKDLPSDDEINKVLEKGQELYLRNGHTPKTTFNFDETAFTWAIGPTHMFCPGNQQRATNIGISDSKIRITAVIAVNAEGIFAPLMLILKHSVSSEKRPDQTNMTVIRKMHQKHGFTVDDGWALKVWSREMTVKNVSALHKVIYLIHEETGHVITSQVKAWNDTIRMALWFDVVIKPLKETLGKMLLWCDNCGSHKTSSVLEVIDEIGVDVAFLPKNMTGELQVLDLVVNGPLKAHIRTNRANVLYQSFQEYKQERVVNNALPIAQRKKLDFDPPKPTQIGGIKDLIGLFNEQFTEEKFKDCINRTFIKTGTLPIHAENEDIPPTFLIYAKDIQNGTMSIVPEGTIDFNDDDVMIDSSEQNEVNEIEELEKLVLNYYAQNNDVLEDEDDEEDDSDNDSDDTE